MDLLIELTYYLSKAGNEVSIIDDGPEMTPASEGNCGLITPSHIMPLNSIHAIFQGVKWLGKKDAPLKIRPQLSLTFISWFFNFIKYSRTDAVKKATLARHKLLLSSFHLYEAFFKDEPSHSEWNTDGLLYVCTGKKSLDHLAKETEEHRKFNMKSRILDEVEVKSEEPLLKDNIVGGVLMEMDNWLNPTQLLKDIKKINKANGVRYYSEKVNSFHLKNSGIHSVTAEKNRHHADEFLLCAGANSVLLAKKLNIKLPIIPGKGYNLTTKHGQTIDMKRPLYLSERKVVATPWSNGFRIGSTMEFVGYDLKLNQNRLEALKNATNEYINIDLDSFEFTPWAGWRPMKDDGIPIIERNDKIKNLIIATGHGMLGLSMAPATGHIVNELIRKYNN